MEYQRLLLGKGLVAVGASIRDWEDDLCFAPTMTFEKLKAPHNIGYDILRIGDDAIDENTKALAISFTNRESALVVLEAAKRIVKMFDEPIAPHWVTVQVEEKFDPLSPIPAQGGKVKGR